MMQNTQSACCLEKMVDQHNEHYAPLQDHDRARCHGMPELELLDYRILSRAMRRIKFATYRKELLYTVYIHKFETSRLGNIR